MVVLNVLVALVAATGLAGLPTQYEVSGDSVYYGDPAEFTSPATVVARNVFEKIPEYQPILKGEVRPGDPRYELLLRKTCEIFYAAVKRCAESDGLDLVAEKGSVTGEPEPPDITARVIKALARD